MQGVATLDPLARLFVAPGRRVLVQAPTHLCALQALVAHEPAKGGPGRAALAPAVPDVANPTGETMPAAAPGPLPETARAAELRSTPLPTAARTGSPVGVGSRGRTGGRLGSGRGGAPPKDRSRWASAGRPVSPALP
jgi:hypothetical protein